MSTVRELFQSTVNNFPQNLAVAEGDKRVTYEYLDSMVSSLSLYLHSKGIAKGDAVVILLPNSIEFVAAFFALANIGAISVPVNTSYKQNEISYYVDHSDAKLILTEDRLKSLADDIASGLNKTVSIVKGDGADWCSENSALEQIPIEPTDQVIYLYSTGSTGKPKRVSRTHNNLVALADNHTQTVGWSEDDRILFTVPISHTYGFGNFISSVKIGASIFTLADFNRAKVLQTLQAEAITVFPAVPVMIDVLSKTFLKEPVDLSSLKLVISAGAPLPEATFNSFYKQFGIYTRQLYGSSETGVISINLSEDIQSTYSSVGRPVVNVVVKILDENSKELGVDEVGEIAVKSPSMTTSGYYGLPEETKEVFRDGYYFTGDLGRIDSEGYIYIVGRKKLFINISGNKVDPVELENLLLEHDRVKEAAVLGVEDGKGGEIVKAVIVSEKSLETKDIISFCRGKISDYKIPSLIEFRNELPRSPTGKVLREQLK
ncbi:MAG: class I adenylate-forming enzyme family protein [Thermodesulfobacteriota bacterium]